MAEEWSDELLAPGLKIDGNVEHMPAVILVKQDKDGQLGRETSSVPNVFNDGRGSLNAMHAFRGNLHHAARGRFSLAWLKHGEQNPIAIDPLNKPYRLRLEHKSGDSAIPRISRASWNCQSWRVQYCNLHLGRSPPPALLSTLWMLTEKKIQTNGSLFE